MSKPAITFLGTGLMGAPMAANLLKAGFPVTTWNRSPQKAAPLASLGATIAATPAEAATGAGIVIMMLTDGAASGQMLFHQGVAGALRPGTLVIDMASTKPGEARDHAVRLADKGIAHLDAPVSGGTRGAEAATLAIMAGGGEEAFARAKPVLEAMGRPVHVGPDGAGQLAKLANQMIVATAIGVVAEAMLMLEKGGADPAAVRAALKGGFADSTILQQHGERMTTGNFVPGGACSNQLKDCRNALAEAASLGLTLPLTLCMEQRYARLVNELGAGDKDHSAIWLELKNINGLA